MPSHHLWARICSVPVSCHHLPLLLLNHSKRASCSNPLTALLPLFPHPLRTAAAVPHTNRHKPTTCMWPPPPPLPFWPHGEGNTWEKGTTYRSWDFPTSQNKCVSQQCLEHKSAFGNISCCYFTDSKVQSLKGTTIKTLLTKLFKKNSFINICTCYINTYIIHIYCILYAYIYTQKYK